MTQFFAMLFEKAKGNPVGIVLVVVAFVIFKGCEALPEAMEPFRTIGMGLGATIGVAGGAWVGRSRPSEEPPK